jgi:hypothetical protein
MHSLASLGNRNEAHKAYSRQLIAELVLLSHAELAWNASHPLKPAIFARTWWATSRCELAASLCELADCCSICLGPLGYASSGCEVVDMCKITRAGSLPNGQTQNWQRLATGV